MGQSVLQDVLPFAKAGALVLLCGTVFALLVPNSSLAWPWGPISDVLGITYTLAWSYSFYPQFFLNLRRRCALASIVATLTWAHCLQNLLVSCIAACILLASSLLCA